MANVERALRRIAWAVALLGIGEMVAAVVRGEAPNRDGVVAGVALGIGLIVLAAVALVLLYPLRQWPYRAVAALLIAAAWVAGGAHVVAWGGEMMVDVPIGWILGLIAFVGFLFTLFGVIYFLFLVPVVNGLGRLADRIPRLRSQGLGESLRPSAAIDSSPDTAIKPAEGVRRISRVLGLRLLWVALVAVLAPGIGLLGFYLIWPGGYGQTNPFLGALGPTLLLVLPGAVAIASAEDSTTWRRITAGALFYTTLVEVTLYGSLTTPYLGCSVATPWQVAPTILIFVSGPASLAMGLMAWQGGRVAVAYGWPGIAAASVAGVMLMLAVLLLAGLRAYGTACFGL
jgi:hypothetical protein